MNSVILLRRRGVAWGAAMAARLVGSSLILASSLTAGTANPVPYVNEPLVPDAVAPGGPAFTLTLGGTGFVSGSVVNWNGSELATTFVDGSRLTAAVPATDIAASSTASITVVNP